mgnify:CR=1 FL=1
MLETKSYEEAISWALELGSIGIVAQVWIPKSGFLYALKNTDGSVSFCRDGSPNFGLGLGTDPIIDPKWERFALPKSFPKEKLATTMMQKYENFTTYASRSLCQCRNL